MSFSPMISLWVGCFHPCPRDSSCIPTASTYIVKHESPKVLEGRGVTSEYETRTIPVCDRGMQANKTALILSILESMEEGMRNRQQENRNFVEPAYSVLVSPHFPPPPAPPGPSGRKVNDRISLEFLRIRAQRGPAVYFSDAT